jgi:hypothetical protein
LNEILIENYKGNSYKNTLGPNNCSLINSPNKSRRCFSYDRLDNAELELNLNNLKKPSGSFSSDNSSVNKFESQSTNFMSGHYDDSNFNINSINSELSEFSTLENSAFNLETKNPLSNLSYVDLPKSNLENLISQNLIITDEVVKIIIVGDKGVGKTLFINKFCDNSSHSKNYESTIR